MLQNLAALREFSRTAVLAGLRGRAIQVVLGLGILLMGVAYLSASFSPRQPQTVALDVGFSVLRIVLILLGLFWVQDLVTREIDRRTVVLSLAYPTPRGSYLIGRYCGVLALMVLATAILSLLLWSLVFVVGKGYAQSFPVLLGLPYWAAVAGIWLDAAVVVAFALMLASLSTVPSLPIALGMAFAIGGRGLGAARSYIEAGADGQADLVAQMSPVLNLIHWLIPDLSRLDWRERSLYGVYSGAEPMWTAALSASTYALVMIFLAVHVFSKREFT